MVSYVRGVMRICLKYMLSCRIPTRTVRISVLRIMRASRQELTTRDEYLATRFTKLSASGHDLTPLTQSEVSTPSGRFIASPLQPLLTNHENVHSGSYLVFRLDPKYN